MDENLKILLNLDISKEEELNRDIYFNKFNIALEEFIKGNWDDAKLILTELKHLRPDDRPVSVLLEHIDSHNGEPPFNWKNCRPLY